MVWWKNNTEAGLKCQQRYYDSITKKITNQKTNQMFAPKENNIKPSQWKKLLSFVNGVCFGCKTKKRLGIDHIIPISKGGKNEIFNVQPLCKCCNEKKGQKTIRFVPFSLQFKSCLNGI